MANINGQNINQPIPVTIPVVTKGDPDLREYTFRKHHFMLITRWNYSAFLNSCIGLVFACFVNLIYDAANAKIPADQSLKDIDILRKDFVGLSIALGLLVIGVIGSRWPFTERQKFIKELKEHFK